MLCVAAIVLVVVTGVLVGGCGGSAGGPITRSRALAYANAVNLRESDVLGWERRQPGGVRQLTRADIDFARCTGVVDPRRRIVTVQSALFAGNSQNSGAMRSQVVVMPTPALAAHDISARLARTSACLGSGEHREVVKTPLGNVTLRFREVISRLPMPLASVPGSYELRDEQRDVAPLTEELGAARDLLGFRSGPAEVTLISFGGRGGVPLATEQQALIQLYRRAKAHPL